MRNGEMQRDSILKYSGVIYKITNKISGKIYIGQTRQNVKERWQAHIQDAYNKKRDKQYLHKAIVKYGESNFLFEVIYEVKSLTLQRLVVLLDALEVFYISKYKTCDPKLGYNLTSGGQKGYVLSEEARRKLSESHVGYVWTAESKQKLSQTITGRKYSEETKARISVALKGKKKNISPQQRKESSIRLIQYNHTRKGIPIEEQVKLKSALTQQTYRYWICDLDGNELVECYSSKQVMKYLQVPQRTISSYFSPDSQAKSLKGYLLKRQKISPDMDKSFQNNYVPDSQIQPLPIKKTSCFLNIKYVAQDKAGQKILTFNSLKEIAEYFKLKVCTEVSGVLNTDKTYKGYYWTKTSRINFCKEVT